MHRATMAEIEKRAASIGLTVETAAPGDGVRRYTFHRKGHYRFAALGISAASDMLAAYSQGVWDQQTAAAEEARAQEAFEGRV